ncbi:BatA domain-containing protein [bacterium]|nr:BatA domain-containing protein [bacterium]
MNFLNPFILFGLGAAVLPILIHLISRRRARDVAFPSIKLLEKMRTDRIRRLRLKQLIVLLLRTIILILIVLAFARPAIRSVFRRNARTAAVIVIDGSASMQYVHNGEILFDLALRRAREILEMLGDDDSGAVILSAGSPDMVGPGMTTDKKELVKALETIEPSFTGGDPTAAVTRSVSLLNTSGSPNRELYYLTDGASNALPDSIGAASNAVRLYHILLGPEKRGGAVIDNLELVDRLVTAGGNVTFRASGLAGEEDDKVIIELFVNGERKGRTPVDKRAGGVIEADFSYTPEKPGWYSVYATAGDGRFESGETRRLVLHVPRKAAVLVAGGKPDDLYFLQRVLDPDPERSMFSVRTVLSDEVTPDEIALADVIVLSGVPSLSENLYRSLRSAVVERGAGLVVFPPETMDSGLYENGLFRDIIPLTVEKRVLLRDTSKGGYTRIDWFDMNHPILRGVSRDGNFRKPDVRSYAMLQPSGTTNVIARFSDGSMAIGDARSGKGRAVVFGIDATVSGSELPLTGIFVPLFIRTIQYLSGTFVTGESYSCGETVDETIGDITGNTPVTIKPEDGPARSVTIDYTGAGAVIKGETAGRPGFYSVIAGGEELKRFSADIPRNELLFQRAGRELIARAYRHVSWKALDGSGNLMATITGDRYGTELFGLFIMLALVILVIEMVLSRKL